MGVGIAVVFARAGIACALVDPDEATRRSADERVRNACRSLEVGPEELLALITVHDDMAAACRGASLIIEAGPESIAVKQEIFAVLDAVAEPDAILATNTSAIPISTIAEAVADPSRVVGTHFWNPPYLVSLVEVVQGANTSPAVVEETIGLLDGIGMRAVHVKSDVPGFVGNRMQHALKREAIALVANGVCTAETVDTVVRYGFGRRLGLVGPLEQADLAGLNLTLAIHEVLMPDLDVTPVPHPYLTALVERGDLGAKTGRGFYTWSPGEAERRRVEIAAGLVDQAEHSPHDDAETPVDGGGERSDS
jgi:3-hydroxybutyryl-CoA dehydrogenase